jgi:glycosyltransferase involved in cell wall biosynthesis
MHKITHTKIDLCWLTADYFIDVDKEIIKSLSKNFKIHWHIILTEKENHYKEAEINQWKSQTLEITIHLNSYRQRNPMSFLFFSRLLKKIKMSSQILYLNYSPTLFFSLASIFFLKTKNVIVTAHQGEVHKGFKFKFIYWFSYKLFYSHFKVVNMFSKSEATKFEKSYPKNRIFIIPLPLNNFGKYKEIKKNYHPVEFLNFGRIRRNKNIELLIDVACKIYEKGEQKFRVTIAGECENWEVYKEKIKYPEIFNLIIRQIENNEITDLFSKSHYLVLPYSLVTQSGPLKIAYYYNVPVIASNLPGFNYEIIDDKTGFLFQVDNAQDLERVMVKAINYHNEQYQAMKQKLAEYVEFEYSDKIILNKYYLMFAALNLYSEKELAAKK